jgi:hypothetical protein
MEISTVIILSYLGVGGLLKVLRNEIFPYLQMSLPVPSTSPFYILYGVSKLETLLLVPLYLGPMFTWAGQNLKMMHFAWRLFLCRQQSSACQATRVCIHTHTHISFLPLGATARG